VDCQLFQIDDPENDGEREMLNFLSRLPPDYFVYRELKIDSTFRQKTKGLKKRQPDFVVAAEDIGVVSIEVKDWNLRRNRYQWENQEKIIKVEPDGSHKRLDNPFYQAETYQYALMDLLKKQTQKRPFVSSLVAFPTLPRDRFYNQIGNRNLLENPQNRFYLDPDRTVFKDQMSDCMLEPQRLLQSLVEKNDNFRSGSEDSIRQTKECLLPSSFRIGDYTRRQEAKENLKTLTQEQQEWVFDLSDDTNYLMDVAGSGKTNCLISKAMHVVDTQSENEDVRILLTTYSEDLAENIERIFRHKMQSREERSAYREYIDVKGLEQLKEAIVFHGTYGTEELREFRESESSEDYRNLLQEEAIQTVAENHSNWSVFTHIFVDEIQDLDNQDLELLSLLSKNDNYFLVGDFGQKIYERSQDLKQVGIEPSRAQLPKTYQMHRTPQHIAQLATRFVFGDERLKREFRRQGYLEDPTYPNQGDQLPMLEREDDPIQATVERVKDFLLGGPSGITYQAADMMVIAPSSKRTPQREALEANGIACVEGESKQGDQLNVVDFRQAKGLEKEVVIIHGIEDLYRKAENENLFGSSLDKKKSKRRLRRILYVALTRSLEQLIVFYQDRRMLVIEELVSLSNSIRDEATA
jgi:hypothetical protein